MSNNSIISLSELNRLAELGCLPTPQGAAADKLREQISEIISYVGKVRECILASEVKAGQDSAVRLRADIIQENDLGQLDHQQPSWLKQSSLAEGNLVAVPYLFNHQDDE